MEGELDHRIGPGQADELATADPAQIIALLRPCLLSLAGQPDPGGPPD